MHPDVHRYLDGEVPRSALPPELASEAAEWDALLDAAVALQDTRAPGWLEGVVMSAVAAPRPRPAWRRAVAWLLEPQPVRIRPIAAAGAAAAVVLTFALWPSAAPRESVTVGPTGPAARVASDGAAGTIYVQFVLAAAGARSVSVAGDFNDWQAERSLLHDPDGDGVWTALVPIPSGVHKYMFVVDGERWVTDPRAERYVDDGFGMRNSLLSVPAPSGRAS